MNRYKAAEVVRSVFLSWYPSLLRFARRAGGRLDIAEEAVQEAFMALYLELLEGTRVENPKAWTLLVVRRQIGKYYRTEKRNSEKLERFAATSDLSTAGVPGDDSYDELFELFSVLSEREEEVLLLRLEAYDYREIARQLGISKNSVKTLLTRAFRKLRAAAKTNHRHRIGDALRGHDVAQTLQ